MKSGPPPITWSYFCALPTTYRQVNGSGWVPIDFTSLSGVTTLPILPIDPINAVTNGLYYTYVKGGSWKLTALFESQKQAKTMASDGGPDLGIFEIGTNLNLANFQRGLVGYWKFDENSDFVASDSADVGGYGSPGSYPGVLTPFPTDGPTWSPGLIGSAISFDGNNDYINITNGSDLNPAKITVALWIKNNSPPAPNDGVLGKVSDVNWSFTGYGLFYNSASQVRFFVNHYANRVAYANFSNPTEWHHFVGTYDGSTVRIYVDGVEGTQGAFLGSIIANTNNLTIGRIFEDTYNIKALIDDVRIYERALSAIEIQALYNATKP